MVGTLIGISLGSRSALAFPANLHIGIAGVYSFTPSLYATVSSMMLARAYDTPLLIQGGASHSRCFTWMASLRPPSLIRVELGHFTSVASGRRLQRGGPHRRVGLAGVYGDAITPEV